MTRPESVIIDEVREVLEKMGVEGSVGPETRVHQDLELDSMRRIELAIEIENHFRVILEPEDEAEIETVGDLCRIVARRLPAGESDRAETRGEHGV
ncbi:MAG: acyl carrier protein [Gemmatimonadota bacterium]|nr:acyl carrier protein [Gemmatimonadota bacterium]